jgi:hypothetical protein
MRAEKLRSALVLERPQEIGMHDDSSVERE